MKPPLERVVTAEFLTSSLKAVSATAEICTGLEAEILEADTSKPAPADKTKTPCTDAWFFLFVKKTEKVFCKSSNTASHYKSPAFKLSPK